MTTYSNPYRWVVLTVFLIVAGLSQLLWLNFAPILTLVESRYQITESTASLLILVFPLIYVVLSIPAGSMIDKKGYRFAVGFGAILMAIFACLRIYDSNFWVILAAQIGIAIAQPYVINGVSKLVADWFSTEQSAIATGLATMGMFIGMALGMAATPAMVEAWSYHTMLIAFALISCAICAAFLLLVKENPDNKNSASTESAAIQGISTLLTNRNLVLLFIISFLGLGFFNGITTWLEPILAPNGLNSMQAGNIGGMLIFGGIVGAAIVPALSDYFKRRKPFIVGSIAAALLTCYPLAHTTIYSTAMILSALQGFFFLPAFALLLESCAELSGKARAGSATGILMLAGNGGGVVVILAMDWIRGGKPSWVPSIILLLVILLAALLLSLRLPETYKHRG